MRLVVDYKKPNKVTKKDNLFLPKINQTLEKLKEATIYTYIDLKKRFWQVLIAEKDRYKTAFSIKYGTYKFLVMPFGLTNAPATFQRMMKKLFEDYIGKFVEMYVNDIIIYSKNFEEHLIHLKKVFKALDEVNLKLSIEKSKFCQKKVKFLGYIVSEQGIKVDKKKIQSIREFPIPKNLRELRGFLGLTSYYKKFIEKFSHVAKLLNTLLKKDIKYNWNEKCQKAFEELKQRLINMPIFRYPDFKKPFYIITDTSGIGLGVILSQKDKYRREYIIEYASKNLNNAKSNYFAQELECLAVYWAVEHFYLYIGYNKFYLVIDNAALK